MTLSQALVGETIPPANALSGYLAAVAVCANTFGWSWAVLTEHPAGGRSSGQPSRSGWARFISPQAAETWRNGCPGRRSGGLVFTIFVATTLMALEQVRHVELSSLPFGAVLLAAGIIALVLLVRHENRTASPLIPLALLRRPAIWRSDAMAACHGAALVSLIVFVPVYLQVVRGFTPSGTGVLLVPLTIGIGIGSLVTGRLVNSTGRTTVFPVVGLALVTVNLVVLAIWASMLGTAALAVIMLCNGLFFGTVMGVVQVSVQARPGNCGWGRHCAILALDGAAFGNALVATPRSPCCRSAIRKRRRLAVMVEHAGHAGAGPSADQRAAIQKDIAAAFSAAFCRRRRSRPAGFPGADQSAAKNSLHLQQRCHDARASAAGRDARPAHATPHCRWPRRSGRR